MEEDTVLSPNCQWDNVFSHQESKPKPKSKPTPSSHEYNPPGYDLEPAPEMTVDEMMLAVFGSRAEVDRVKAMEQLEPALEPCQLEPCQLEPCQLEPDDFDVEQAMADILGKVRNPPANLDDDHERQEHRHHMAMDDDEFDKLYQAALDAAPIPQAPAPAPAPVEAPAPAAEPAAPPQTTTAQAVTNTRLGHSSPILCYNQTPSDA